MSLRKYFGSVLSAITVAAVPLAFAAGAQEAPAKGTTPAAASAAWDANAVPEGGMPRYIKEETPEQRRDRLGTTEDPGINPDPNRVWWRFGREWKIAKFEKRWSRETDRPGYIKPFAVMNFVEELYQQNEKFVWVWVLEVPPPKPLTDEELRASQYRKVDEADMKVIEALRPEFTALEPAKAGVRLRFENSSTGLPDSGSWRSSLAVADMNGDGHADIILPPERGGRVTPSIFVGDGKGGWKHWPVKWPARLNYGSVVAADFNKDKKMDLAFGIHLSGIVILLQEQGGTFREVVRHANFPTRRVLARDVDADGWMDVVAISEGPIIRNKSMVEAGATNLRGYMNRKKGESWTAMNIAGPQQRVSGDWLASGYFNGDKYPDFSGSSAYINGVDIIYLSKGPNQYEVLPGGNDVVPWRSYYWATTAGRFSAKDRDDAIVSFVRQWIPNLNPDVVPPPPLDQVVGLDRISFEGGTPKRTPIARWGGATATEVRGVNHGDFDGDGHQDLIYSRGDTRRLHILLGNGRGEFREAEVDGLTLNSNSHYDIQVADVNGDRRPDVVMMFEAESGTALSRKNGKVEVFLNRGVAKGE
jgi:hypothetical protein